MTARAFVLLSGGIDSSTCLKIALREFGEGNVRGVSIFYGQRHRKEIQYASIQCHINACDHSVLNLFNIVPRTMLTDETATIPNISYDQIVGISPTYVPYRNGLMLSALASWVEGHRVDGDREEWGLYFGAHAEDARAWAYPDCTPEFIGAIANAIFIGTYHRLRLHTPLQWMNKKQIIQRGTHLKVDWQKTWSCYAGGELHCGTCPTCRARQEGFRQAKVDDPTEYAA